MTKPKREKKLCGATTRQGTPCKRAAGAGTEHPGLGHCSNHLGNTPSGVKHAAKEAAAAHLAGLDLLASDTGVHIEPHDALLLCVRSAAARVYYFNACIRDLTADDVVTRPMQEKAPTENHGLVDVAGPHAANILVVLRDKALDDLARWSKMALDAGVAERQVQLAERSGAVIADLLEALLGDLDLSKKQWSRVREVLPGHLQRLTIGDA